MTFSRFLQRVCFTALLVTLASCSALTSLIEPWEEPEQGQESVQEAASSKGEGEAQTSDQANTAASENTEEDAASERALLLGRIGSDPFLSSQSVSPDVSAAFSQGVQAMQAENWQAAEQAFTPLTVQEPQLSGPYLNLGIIAKKRSNEELAEQHFKAAIQANRANQEAYNQLALLQKELGRFDEAEASYIQAIDVWAGSPNTHKNLGILYEMYMGKLPEALVQYQACAALLAAPDRQLKGWMIDLQRRIAKAKAL